MFTDRPEYSLFQRWREIAGLYSAPTPDRKTHQWRDLPEGKMAGQMGPGILSSGLLSPTGLLWRKGRHLSARKWNLVPRSARRYEIDRSVARPATVPGFLCECSADRYLQSESCRKRFGAAALLLHRYRSLRRLPKGRRRYSPAASRLPAKARFQ